MIKLIQCFFITLILLHLLSSKANAMDIDFNNPAHVTEAKISNDTVMGGLSASKIDNQQGKSAIFSGHVSLENNGGFASIEYQIQPQVPDSNIIKLKVLGDGKRYQLRLKTAKLSFGEAYVADFDTQVDQWTEHEFSTTDFKSRFRGRSVNAPELIFVDIKSIGFLIADKQQGQFSITLESVTFN